MIDRGSAMKLELTPAEHLEAISSVMEQRDRLEGQLERILRLPEERKVAMLEDCQCRLETTKAVLCKLTNGDR